MVDREMFDKMESRGTRTSHQTLPICLEGFYGSAVQNETLTLPVSVNRGSARKQFLCNSELPCLGSQIERHSSTGLREEQ